MAARIDKTTLQLDQSYNGGTNADIITSNGITGAQATVNISGDYSGPQTGIPTFYNDQIIIKPGAISNYTEVYLSGDHLGTGANALTYNLTGSGGTPKYYNLGSDTITVGDYSAPAYTYPIFHLYGDAQEYNINALGTNKIFNLVAGNDTLSLGNLTGVDNQAHGDFYNFNLTSSSTSSNDRLNVTFGNDNISLASANVSWIVYAGDNQNMNSTLGGNYNTAVIRDGADTFNLGNLQTGSEASALYLAGDDLYTNFVTTGTHTNLQYYTGVDNITVGNINDDTGSFDVQVAGDVLSQSFQSAAASSANIYQLNYANDTINMGNVTLDSGSNEALQVSGELLDLYVTNNETLTENYGSDIIHVGDIYAQPGLGNLITGDVTYSHYNTENGVAGVTQDNITYGNDTITTGEVYSGDLWIAGDQSGVISNSLLNIASGTATATFNYGIDSIQVGAAASDNTQLPITPLGKVNMSGDTADHNISVGSSGNTTTNSTVTENFGSDTKIDGGETNDYIRGDSGTINLVFNGDTTQNNTVNLNFGGDTISGDGGNDVIAGDVQQIIVSNSATSNQNNQVNLNYGNDIMNGGDGNDILFGDAGGPTGIPLSNTNVNVTYGNDTLTGGNGDDQFHFFVHGQNSSTYGLEGNDVITDFTSNDNLIIHSINEAGWTFGSEIYDQLFSVTDNANGTGNVVITARDGGSITLQGASNGENINSMSALVASTNYHVAITPQVDPLIWA